MNPKTVLAWLVALGPKVDQAWPHLKAIGQELNAILTVMNGGHPITTAAGPSTPEGSQVVSKLTSTGKVTSEEAGKFAALLEAAHGRVAA